MYTLRINAYRYVQYIHIQYIYIHTYISEKDSRYHIFQHILICPLCFTTVCLTSVDQKGSATAHLGWISLGKAAYDSGLNEDSVL